MAGCLVAVLYQTDATLKFGNAAGELANNVALIKGVWLSLFSGYQASTGDAVLDDLLSRGGMNERITSLDAASHIQ